ncbi:gluconate kinase [Nocardioides gansuensis]|uniref:Gluconokinase n=2 Tax=Nocardioides gansuensis TaxID=2138300 RepID=A0A2T8F7X9_9ACTN|nr:gluconate kinase [Nocardioides gansuensis]
MGVSGTGKSAVGRPVAERLGYDFAEGDDFHPEANVRKMRAGVPLTDEDRWPWLRSLAEWTRERAGQGRSTVLTCSALKRAYRDVLREAAPDTVFVHLVGDKEVLARRMAEREHFMPRSLLDSQFETLEPLGPDEEGVEVDSSRPLDEVVGELVARFPRQP